jgi:hypothetical protein
MYFNIRCHLWETGWASAAKEEIRLMASFKLQPPFRLSLYQEFIPLIFVRFLVGVSDGGIFVCAKAESRGLYGDE